MGDQTKLSGKGQVVIPKELRDALAWEPGTNLSVRRSGGRVILEPIRPDRPRISYEEFRRRVPAYQGKPKTIEEMDAGIAKIFRDWNG